MKSYSAREISMALRDSGVDTGSTVFFCARLFSVGKLLGIESREAFCRAYLEAIFEVIGTTGTLVVPTYTQQVGRYGVPYYHEATPTQTGLFNEFLRNQVNAVRSFHPVCSLSSFGFRAQEICSDVGPSSFGARSAYAHLFGSGAVAVSLGFDLEEGYLVTGAHHLESLIGVPYYYNKIVDAEVYRGGQLSDRLFTLNVCYRDFGIVYDFSRYVNELKRKCKIESSNLGDAALYTCSLQDQMQIGMDLLCDDPYSFLREPPCWKKGQIPFEGVENRVNSDSLLSVNWAGFQLVQ